MVNNFESDLEKLNEEVLRYVGVTNLDFRSSLSKDELQEVQNLLFSINTLMQVSFKDGTSVEDIENIKYMLELSPMCEDKKIEKMILRNNTPEEVKKLLSMSYINPDTWHISYEIKDGTYMITTLPNYRVMEEYINIVLSCLNGGMSLLEKIKEVYDFVKLLEYSDKDSSRIPDIIKNRKTNSLGFSLLFSEILKRIGVKSYIGEIKRGNKIESVCIINVEDEKYGASGLYAFDPMSDSIPKELYKSDAIRKVNYNFFCLPLADMIDTKDDDKFLNVLSLLLSESLEYFGRKLEYKDRAKLENGLGINYVEVYEKAKKTKRISDNKLLNLFISTVHEDDFLGLNRDISDLLSNNYHLRKKEIFNDKNNNEVTQVNVHDI